MEKADVKNIICICKDCAEMRKMDWQDHNKNIKIKKGDFVKVALRDDGMEEQEHCWVHVTEVSKNGNIIWGILDNIPVILKTHNYKEPVVLKRDEIEDYSARRADDEFKRR